MKTKKLTEEELDALAEMYADEVITTAYIYSGIKNAYKAGFRLAEAKASGLISV